MAGNSIEEILKNLSLEKYVPKFKEQEIDMSSIFDLTDNDMEKIIPPIGPRRKLQNYMKQLSRTPSECRYPLSSQPTVPSVVQPPPQKVLCPLPPQGLHPPRPPPQQQANYQPASQSPTKLEGVNPSSVGLTAVKLRKFDPSNSTNTNRSQPETVSAPSRVGYSTSGQTYGNAAYANAGYVNSTPAYGNAITAYGNFGSYCSTQQNSRNFQFHRAKPFQRPLNDLPVDVLLTNRKNMTLDMEEFKAWVKTVKVSAYGDRPPQPVESFSCITNPRLREQMNRINFLQPTPIQKHTLACMKAKRDILAAAQTGSGKTASFLLPIIDSLSNPTNSKVSPKCFQALIIEPTRELAQQAYDDARILGHGILRFLCLVAGTPRHRLATCQIQGVHVVVATPGRLEGELQNGRIFMGEVQYLVMDEVDRVFDPKYGRGNQCYAMLELYDLPSPKMRQTLLFSCSIDKDIIALVHHCLNDGSVMLKDENESGCNKRIKQLFKILDVTMDRKEVLLQTIQEDIPADEAMIIFANTTSAVDELAQFLKSQLNIAAYPVHRDIGLADRDNAIRRFREGKCRIIVASDILARGIDFPRLNYVIQYNLPRTIQDYVCRVGRTGRLINPKGVSIAFYSQKDDVMLQPYLVSILASHEQEIPPFFGNTPELNPAAGSGGEENGWGWDNVAENEK